MSDGKKRFKGHITAAKEWLGRAENSLDQDNEIKGDLNLMLAQAELQRAKETKQHKNKHGLAAWLVRLMPVAAAALIVWAVILPAISPVSQPAQRTAAAEETARLPVASAVKIPPAAGTELPAASRAVPVEPPAAAAPAAESGPDKAKPPQPLVEAAPPSTRAEAPPEQMQKLMRVAGKTLRSQ